MAIFIREILGIKEISTETEAVFPADFDGMQDMVKNRFGILIIQKCPQEVEADYSFPPDYLLGKFIRQVSLVVPNVAHVGMACDDRDMKFVGIDVLQDSFRQ